MGNILTAKVKIVGVRPLFFHHFGPESIALEKQEKTGVAGNDPEQWRKTVTVTHDGQLFMDSTYAFATIREGAKFVPKKRGSIQPMVIATLQIKDVRIMVDRYWPGYPNGHQFDVKKADPLPSDSELPVYMDVRGGVNPSTKAHMIIYRVACAPGWSCEFSIVWDKTVVSRAEMESAIINAGKLSGIGNGRKIGMGRYELEQFEVVE